MRIGTKCGVEIYEGQNTQFPVAATSKLSMTGFNHACTPLSRGFFRTTLCYAHSFSRGIPARSVAQCSALSDEKFPELK